jgi:hypothetical protein
VFTATPIDSQGSPREHRNGPGRNSFDLQQPRPIVDAGDHDSEGGAQVAETLAPDGAVLVPVGLRRQKSGDFDQVVRLVVRRRQDPEKVVPHDMALRREGVGNAAVGSDGNLTAYEQVATIRRDFNGVRVPTASRSDVRRVVAVVTQFHSGATQGLGSAAALLGHSPGSLSFTAAPTSRQTSAWAVIAACTVSKS